MKKIKLLIGTMLVLMLCISPVAAVSGTDFEIKIDTSSEIYSYKYFNKVDPDEKYIQLRTTGTRWLYSLVSFKPANIPDAPMMVVDTTRTERYFYLPQSVDEWEIKYYSITHPIYPGEFDKYLKKTLVL